MAEESEEGGSADAEAPARPEWFGRMLGADWVEVEPGIYEYRPLRLTEPPPSPAPVRETPLDAELLENLPTPAEQAERTLLSKESSPRRWLGR